jgi:hypothetical protein
MRGISVSVPVQVISAALLVNAVKGAAIFGADCVRFLSKALKILSLRDDKKTAKVSRLDTLDVLHPIMHQSNVFGFSLPWLDIQNIQWRR